MRKDNDYFGLIDDNVRLAQLVRCSVVRLSHKFFYENNFILVDPPILHEQIPNKKYEVYISDLNSKFSLNSSNALYMAAYASEFQRVYAISPSFRNEQNSINHLVEFRMLEVEIVDMSFDEMVEFINKYIRYILDGIVNANNFSEYFIFKERVKTLSEKWEPIKISFENFIDILRKESGRLISDSVDLSDIDYIVSRYINKPAIIIDYPQRIASWTSKPKHNGLSHAMNLILPETYGELCEGCERTNDIELLQHKMNCAHITNLQWYIDAVKKIQINRCGFGIGLDRLVRWIVGCDNIEATVFFPRKKEG